MKNTLFAVLYFVILGLSLPSLTFAEAIEKPKTVITLPKEYIVPEGKVSVLLGDLAEKISAPNGASDQRLRAFEILPSPRVGEQRRLAQHQILAAIRADGYDYLSVVFEGPKLIDIYGPGQKITVQQMVQAIYQQIKQESGWPDNELVIRILIAPTQDSWLPPKKAEILVDRIQPGILGNARYEVGFYVDRILVEKVPFTVAVGRKRAIYKPLRELYRGEVILPEDLREEIIVLERDQTDQLLADQKAEIVGHRCRIALSKSEPIKWTALETNYVLKPGDVVQMIIRNHGMSLQTLAQAQKRGTLGEVIPVKTVGTGKIVKAKILNSGLVEMMKS